MSEASSTALPDKVIKNPSLTRRATIVALPRPGRSFQVVREPALTSACALLRACPACRHHLRGSCLNVPSRRRPGDQGCERGHLVCAAQASNRSHQCAATYLTSAGLPTRSRPSGVAGARHDARGSDSTTLPAWGAGHQRRRRVTCAFVIESLAYRQSPPVTPPPTLEQRSHHHKRRDARVA